MRIFVYAFFVFLFSCTTTAFGEDIPKNNITFRDINGKKQNLSDYEGEIVLMNFWATWCQPCIAEMPHLQALENELENFHVIAVSIDEARDASKIKPFIKSRGYTFTVTHDKDRSIYNTFSMNSGIPYTVLFDKKGNVIFTHEGFSLGFADMIKKVVKKINH